MGYRVGEIVGKRLGRTILELGGNNAIIVTPEADLKLALRAIVFGSVGTAGQRCTSTRRIIVHESIRDELVERLLTAYRQVLIGNPLDPATLMGPLIHAKAVDTMMKALKRIKEEGGEILEADGEDAVRDAAIIGAAQRVEHYEIAGYGTARTFAEMLGHTEAAELLQKTLDEEKETDQLLTELALTSVNVDAQNQSEL